MNLNKKKTNLTVVSMILVGLLLFSFCFTGCSDENKAGKTYKVVMEQPTGIDYSTKVGDLVSKNNCAYTIIYPTDAGEATIQGAKEIKQMLLDSASAYVNVTTDEGLVYSEQSKYISLGKTKALKNSSLNLDYTQLKHDGYFIKTEGQSVFIDGISDRGILYGAYDFCEHVLGVKYLTYDYNYIPDVDNIDLFKMDITDNPAFEDRCYLNNMFYTDYQYMSRMRCVHEYRDIPAMYGGGLGWFNDTTYLDNYVHNSLSFVSPEIYYNDHPEWFYTDGGNTVDEVIDLCYSHVGLNEDGTIDDSLSVSPVKIAIEKLKECLKNSDDSVKYYMIGQMDVNHTCQCPECLKQNAKYERSGMNIRFINAIYDEVSKWAKEEGITKDWYLCTFAYQWSQNAPVKFVNGKYEILDETVIPRDNVIVRIAPIQADNYYGMLDERQNEKTVNLFNGWNMVLKGKKSMIWSYHVRFSYYFCYYPTMQHWKEDFETYQEIGSQYIFMQADTVGHDWKSKMETYVASKMLWDPTLDASELRDEFIEYYYKGIEDLVADYNANFEIQFALLTSREDAPDMTLQSKDELLDAKYYSVSFWETQLGLVDEMYDRVSKMDLTVTEESFYKTKIDEIKITSEFMLLYHYDSYYFDDYWGRQNMLEDFFNTYLSLQISKWREFNGTVTTLKSLLGYVE